MSKVLILINAFYRVQHVERTIRSILQQETRSKLEVVVLENPSEKSPEMRDMVARISEIGAHFIATENIGNEIFTPYIQNHTNNLAGYDFVAFCEGDVILEPTTLNECIRILTTRNLNRACGAAIRIDRNKYGELPRNIMELEQFNQEIPGTRQCIGRTGFRFHVLKKEAAIDFMRRQPLYGGTGLWREENLNRQCIDEQIISIKTKEAMCEHIGWELRFLQNQEEYMKQLDAKKTLKIGHRDVELREIFKRMRTEVTPPAPIFRGRVQ